MVDELETVAVEINGLAGTDETVALDEAAELDPEAATVWADGEVETAVPKQATPPSLYVLVVVPKGHDDKQVFP